MPWIKDLFQRDGHVTEGGHYRIKERDAKDEDNGGKAVYIIDRDKKETHQICYDKNGSITHEHTKK